MRLEQLDYLIEIAKRKSISLASKELHITQQALSLNISSLEEELGVRLFNRTHKGVSLTAEGKKTVELASEIIEKWSMLIEEFHSNTTVDFAGKLNIVTNPGLNITILPKVISHFYGTYPNIKLNITDCHNDTVIDKVYVKEADIGLINVLEYNGKLEKHFHDNLKYVPFIEYKILVRVNRKSDLARYKSLLLKDILKYPLAILRSEKPNDSLFYKMLQHYGTPNTLLVNSNEIIKQMIKDNVAIGLAVRNINGAQIEHLEDNLLDIIIEDPFIISTGYLINTSEPQSFAVKMLINYLLNHLWQK